jgi:hypothetical protein
MDQTILLDAEKTLRSTSAKAWDTIGFNGFRNTYSSISDEEIIAIWKRAMKNISRTHRIKYLSYAEIGGKYSEMTPQDIEDENNKIILTEVEKWDVLIQFRRVERVADTIVFLTMKNASFEITTDDLFMQTKFRQACMRGTNVKLPEITRPAFETFTDKLKFEVVEGFSISKKIIVKEALNSIALRMKEHVFENEGEAKSFAIRKGVSTFKNFVFFKLTALLDELRGGGRSYDQATLLVALKQLNARADRRAEGNYWVYDSEFTDEEIEEVYDLGKIAPASSF